MKKILALALALVMVLALAACGGSKTEAPAAPAPEAPAPEAPAAPVAEAPAPEAPAAEVTWADYQQYLIDVAGVNAPDLDEFKAQVEAIHSWDEMPLDVSPWDQFFSTLGLSTWEEFQQGIVKELAVVGGPDAAASGEATEEPAADASGEPAADASGEPSDASAEPSAAPPASAAMANPAHGGTPGATSDKDYQAYLKAWLQEEAKVNTTMTADQVNNEFIPMIEAGNYTDFPVEMMFSGMLTTGAAMTYEEFVAANGVY